MKPAPFAYRRPASLDEALALLREHGEEAKVLAGGQSLVPLLNMRLARPSVLVDLNQISGLDGIEAVDGEVRVGALVRQRALEDSPLTAQRLPLAAEALPRVGHLVTRNRGTVGGSIAHADAAAELPLCLLVLGGKVVVRSAEGSREVDAGDFFVTHFTTVLAPDELVVGTVWPALRDGWGFAFEELAQRRGDYGLSMAACALRVEDAHVVDARVGIGSVVERPTLLETELTGQVLTAELARDVGRRAAAVRQRARLGRLPAPPHGRARRAGAAACVAQCSRGQRVIDVDVVVNGRRRRESVEPRLLLSDFLRHGLGLTGTHVGCEHGVCGACTVILDGVAVRSCLMLAAQVDGHELQTVEGLAADGALTPLQEAFREEHALQCGFCTPGMLMTAVDLLAHGRPTREDVTDALSGQICRCTGYEPIVRAILKAAES